MATIEVIRDIFKHNNLGDIYKAKKLEGGRIHETWYVKTKNKEHVIKIYNPNCSPDGEYEKYDNAEKVAHLIKEHGNDNVICAQMTGKTTIQYYNKHAYSLYEYIEGTHLLHAQIKEYHIKKIATFLAQIHSIKAPSECIPPNVYKTESHFVNLMSRVVDQEPSLKNILSLDVIETLNQINQLCIRADKILGEDDQLLLSHGDMDVPNVLWKNSEPYIIDWEYAGLKHPIVELIYCAIYWSRNADGSIDSARYEKLINTYLQMCPIKNIAYANEALYRVLGELMMWLHYNMLRLSDKWTIKKNERSIAIEQLQVFIPTVINVHIQTDIFLEPIFRL